MVKVPVGLDYTTSRLQQMYPSTEFAVDFDTSVQVQGNKLAFMPYNEAGRLETGIIEAPATGRFHWQPDGDEFTAEYLLRREGPLREWVTGLQVGRISCDAGTAINAIQLRQSTEGTTRSTEVRLGQMTIARSCGSWGFKEAMVGGLNQKSASALVLDHFDEFIPAKMDRLVVEGVLPAATVAPSLLQYTPDV